MASVWVRVKIFLYTPPQLPLLLFLLPSSDVVNVAASVGTDADAESCLMQSAHFSPSAAFATITCLVGIVPRVYLVALSNGTAGHGPSATQHQQQPNSNLDIVQSMCLRLP